MAKKLKTFNIQAKLDLFISIEIKAESLEDAVAQARQMSETDFVTIEGEFIDGSKEITGVYE